MLSHKKLWLSWALMAGIIWLIYSIPTPLEQPPTQPVTQTSVQKATVSSYDRTGKKSLELFSQSLTHEKNQLSAADISGLYLPQSPYHVDAKSVSHHLGHHWQIADARITHLHLPHCMMSLQSPVFFYDNQHKKLYTHAPVELSYDGMTMTMQGTQLDLRSNKMTLGPDTHIRAFTDNSCLSHFKESKP